MPLRLVLRTKISKLTAVATAAALAMAPLPAFAQQEQGPKVLRDTESEQLLRDYTRPVLRAAGLEKQNIQVVIINDRAFNAFVADGHRIFVNYGALMQSKTPNQIIGVTNDIDSTKLAKVHRRTSWPSSIAHWGRSRESPLSSSSDRVCLPDCMSPPPEPDRW